MKKTSRQKHSQTQEIRGSNGPKAGATAQQRSNKKHKERRGKKQKHNKRRGEKQEHNKRRGERQKHNKRRGEKQEHNRDG